MKFFYDGQIRRYLVQTIRLFSNFVVKYNDGTLARVPVMYGDMDRQVSNILRQNSENKIQSAPRISIYISSLEMEKERLADATYVGKMHIRERDTEYNSETGKEEYTSTEGSSYTIERIMPTPYKLSVKADIWSSSTEQKFQILEQILMLFNPSLEIQTTDNYVDWTSLSVLYLDDVNFSSRSVPVGNDSPIDIATLDLSMPIWISPPSKVKRLGLITRISMGMFGEIGQGDGGYIDGIDSGNGGTGHTDKDHPNLRDVLGDVSTVIDNFDIIVYGGQARIFYPDASGHRVNNLIDVGIDSIKIVNWTVIFDKYPGKYNAGNSKIFLLQKNGTEVFGTVAINPLDQSILNVEWDRDSYPTNTNITSDYRPNSPGTFDAIIDPKTKGPNSDLPLPTIGTRYLIIDNIGGGVRETLVAENSSNRIDTTVDYDKVLRTEVYVNNIPVNYETMDIQGKLVIRLTNSAQIDDIITYELFVNEDGPDAWKNSDGSDFIANTNDIIEWTGSKWRVIFDNTASRDTIYYLTNIYTNVQYKWNGVSWVKSFEGEYRKGFWRIAL
jgi:hypothetical protein